MSRSIPPALATASVLLLAASPAMAEGRHEIDFVGFDAGGDYWFNVDDGSERNPEVVLHPGDEVWVDMRNAGGQDHNLRIAGPIDEAVALMPAGHMLAMRFEVPDEPGIYEYWCDPHRELGMIGTFRIAAEEGDAEAPGLMLVSLLGVLSAAVLLKRSRDQGDPP